VPLPFLGHTLQSFPLAEIARPSRGHCSLAVIHQLATTHCLSSFVSSFSNSRAFTRLPGSPCQLRASFPQRFIASRSLWISRSKPLLSISFTRLGALHPLRIRSRWFELPLASGRYSLGLLPLQSFLPPLLGSSNPLGNPNTRLSPKTPASESRDISTPRSG
jgi:hypothetical protein